MEDISLMKPPPKNWQDWLEQFVYHTTSAGWQEFAGRAREADIAPAWAARVYIPLMHTALANAMLCACLQLDESEALAAIEQIARQARQIRFEKSPRALSKELRALYRRLASDNARVLPDVADVFEQVFTRYARGDYDERADANALMSRARALINDRAAALDAVGRAGVAVLRGAAVWSGWPREGSPEFQNRADAVLLIEDISRHIGPLACLADERARAEAHIAALSVNPLSSDHDALPLLNTEDEVSRMIETWMELAGRDEPLSDDEIRAMRDQYQLVAEAAARVVLTADVTLDMELEDRTSREEEEIGKSLALAIDVLGILRYGPPEVVTVLINTVAGDTLNIWLSDLPESAVKALQRIGPPAVEQTFDFVRYSERRDIRADMMRLLGVVGRGNEAVYQYLAGEFNRVSWAEGRSDYALPLALTHDPRAIPLIVEALRDPAVDDDDAWDLLDALQELNVTFYINRDKRAVNIPGYGVIEDVLPWDWQSRAELQALEDAWDDLDLDDEYDDEDEAYDDVVYDEDGTPRCPECGREMHYVNGRWVHELPPAAPKRPRSKSRY